MALNKKAFEDTHVLPKMNKLLETSIFSFSHKVFQHVPVDKSYYHCHLQEVLQGQVKNFAM